MEVVVVAQHLWMEILHPAVMVAQVVDLQLLLVQLSRFIIIVQYLVVAVVEEAAVQVNVILLELMEYPVA
jgi:hypothetical protein